MTPIQRPIQQLTVILALAGAVVAYAVDNPVEYHGMADGGCMKYNGEYFFHGIGSDGLVYRSNDLGHWYDPVHCLSNPDGDAPNFTANWPVDSEQTWAPPFTVGDDWYAMCIDPNYLSDGKFYTYYQVGTHLGLAVGNQPQEDWINHPTNEAPQQMFTNYRIDPNIFRDEDGSLYFYAVRFTDGNVIWGQAMSSPTSLSGSPNEQFKAIDGTWENYDENTKIAEGSDVFKYRGQYYMLYAANNTSADEGGNSGRGYGNYAVGVCQNDSSPLNFGDGGKYHEPGGSYVFVMDAATQSGGQGRIFNTGQPWWIEGPNGFEQWLGYFAHPHGWGRHQFIDRMHFMGKRLYVDGPTNIFTDGYHPGPAMPQYLGLFNEDTDGARPDHTQWQVSSGDWQTHSGELRQVTTTAGGYVAYLRNASAVNYLFEANVKFNAGSTDHQGGVRAYYVDDNNFLLVGFHDLGGGNINFYLHLRENGADNVQVHGLSAATFPLDCYHKIRVEKSGTTFRIKLDDQVFAPVDTIAAPTFGATERVGLFANNGSVSFDGLIYTVGWDEYDNRITGWGDTLSGVAQTGTWSTGASGISQTDSGVGAFTFKGDLMPEYECSTQVTRDSAAVAGSYMGLMPVAIDANNYLMGSVLTDTGQFQVYGVKDGTPMTPITVPLPAWCYTDTGQATGQSWQYTQTDPGAGWEAEAYDDSGWSTGDSGFGEGSVSDGNRRTTWSNSDIWLRRTFTMNQLPSIYSALKVRMDGGSCEVYINGVRADVIGPPPDNAATIRHGGFYKYEEFTAAARDAMHVGTNVLAVHSTDASSPRFIDVGIFNPRLYFEGVDEVNIRAVKLTDRVIFFVNGEQIVDVTGNYATWGPSQVGLVTNAQAATFNGIMVYQTAALPSPWLSADVGPVGGDGRAEYSDGLWTVEGSGHDIWDVSDAFHFMHQPWTGDVTLEARYDDIETTWSADWWAKMGVMIREDLDHDSRHVFNQYAANKQHISQVRRDTKGGTSGAYDLQPIVERELPQWLRLVRSGNTFTSYHSTDGLTWNNWGAQFTFTMNANTYIGLASTAHHNWRLGTARFTNFRAWAPLPSPWIEADIGSPSIAGVSGYFPDSITLFSDASGSDIGAASDQFRFIYQSLTGNGEITARIAVMEDTGDTAKAGVMIRNGLAADANHHFLGLAGNGELQLILRQSAGASSGVQVVAGGIEAPVWVKLRRSNWSAMEHELFYSTNGSNWTQIVPDNNWGLNAMAETVSAGLAVTAGTNSDLCTAEFDNVTVGTIAEPNRAAYWTLYQD